MKVDTTSISDNEGIRIFNINYCFVNFKLKKSNTVFILAFSSLQSKIEVFSIIFPLPLVFVRFIYCWLRQLCRQFDEGRLKYILKIFRNNLRSSD